MSSAVRDVAGRAGRTLTAGVAVTALAATALALDGVDDHPARGTTATVRPVAAAAVTVASHHRTGRKWPGHPGRRVISYRVQRGDTATRIAVRFHAWTAELLAINHKTGSSYWYANELVSVPVVTARAGHRSGKKHGSKPKSRSKRQPHHTSHPSRATVRNEVKRVAARHGVNQHMALAIAWQESGWQQHVRSSAGAVGTMQVMPGTGRWISTLVGRKLHLRRLHDNVAAGVVLYKLLRRDHSVRGALAGYYQGLGSVHAHGMYKSTKRYVRSVKHHKRKLDHGWRPLH